ncbi:hypothetical protein C1J01_01740 [Nonomuraea aridisoli]|uniref:Uncharacterized protein n=1 Tax=Nonomuraea aridisoli TaxID=2070368 RepID=A0A2W2FCA5_9ACTN|nr:hypothetical protein C1J01_01740 [Nonomuraea aridisoli]
MGEGDAVGVGVGVGIGLGLAGGMSSSMPNGSAASAAGAIVATSAIARAPCLASPAAFFSEWRTLGRAESAVTFVRLSRVNIYRYLSECDPWSRESQAGVQPDWPAETARHENHQRWLQLRTATL